MTDIRDRVEALLKWPESAKHLHLTLFYGYPT
jgi:hypothetical protein